MNGFKHIVLAATVGVGFAVLGSSAQALISSTSGSFPNALMVTTMFCHTSGDSRFALEIPRLSQARWRAIELTYYRRAGRPRARSMQRTGSHDRLSVDSVGLQPNGCGLHFSISQKL